MRRRLRPSGYTMIEMMVAMLLSLVVVLAIGGVIVVSQRAWGWGQDKTRLQQNVTEALDWMSRSARGAGRLRVMSSTEFRTYDETDALVHTYELVDVGGVGHLRQDGTDLTERKCTVFSVTPDPDTTSLNLSVELEDKAQNRVLAMTRVTLRTEHPAAGP